MINLDNFDFEICYENALIQFRTDGDIASRGWTEGNVQVMVANYFLECYKEYEKIEEIPWGAIMKISKIVYKMRG